MNEQEKPKMDIRELWEKLGPSALRSRENVVAWIDDAIAKNTATPEMVAEACAALKLTERQVVQAVDVWDVIAKIRAAGGKWLANKIQWQVLQMPWNQKRAEDLWRDAERTNKGSGQGAKFIRCVEEAHGVNRLILDPNEEAEMAATVLEMRRVYNHAQRYILAYRNMRFEHFQSEVERNGNLSAIKAECEAIYKRRCAEHNRSYVPWQFRDADGYDMRKYDLLVSAQARESEKV